MGFWDILTGSAGANTARGAASDTYAKQSAAADASRAAGNAYQAGVQGVSQNYAPYTSGGTAALERLMAGLGLGGDQAAFTRSYQALPGYQEGMNSGRDSVMAGLGVAGGAGLKSGAAQKALYKYGSNYENQRSGDYLSRLFQLSGTGLGATDAQSKMQAQGYLGQLQGGLAGANQQFQGAGTIGQGDVAAANAEAAGAQNLLNTGVSLAGTLMGMPSSSGWSSSFMNPNTWNPTGRANPWASS